MKEGVAGFSETLLAKYTASYSGRRNSGHVNVVKFIVGLFNDALNISVDLCLQIILTYLLTYLVHGAESFLSS